MDGLLGIGKAFGGKSVNESKDLESRLSAMRKERDSQAKNPLKKVATKPPAFPWNTAQPEPILQPTGTSSTTDFDGVTPITDFQPGGRAGMGGSKSKKKKKKK